MIYFLRCFVSPAAAIKARKAGGSSVFVGTKMKQVIYLHFPNFAIERPWWSMDGINTFIHLQNRAKTLMIQCTLEKSFYPHKWRGFCCLSLSTEPVEGWERRKRRRTQRQGRERVEKEEIRG